MEFLINIIRCAFWHPHGRKRNKISLPYIPYTFYQNHSISFKFYSKGFTNVLKVEEKNDFGKGNILKVEEDDISSMWFKFLSREVLATTGRVRNNSEHMVTTIIIYNFIKRVIFKSITI